MRREQLEHLIRAAAAVSGDDELVIVGSQSILGQHPNAPEECLRSDEADVYPKHHPERWELIDGSLGEASPFHATFGYYAQGVEPGVATLPPGWEARLVPVFGPATRGATGWCLETHDLMASKYVANRTQDRRFCRAAIAAGLVNRAVLVERVGALPIEAATRAQLLDLVAADFAAPRPPG
jgi:hypothetical protein